MSKVSQYIVLCEDELQDRFVRKFLTHSGVSPRCIRPIPRIAGEGCGESFVRSKYVNEVQAYRKRQAKAKTALIVVIDADDGTVEDRQRDLSAPAKEKPRDDNDLIVHLIPKRCIETWLLYMNDNTSANESTEKRECKNLCKKCDKQEIQNAIKRFTEIFHDNKTGEAEKFLPSMKCAFDELNRLREFL